MQAVSYPVKYELDMPERLSRWLWLIKWLLVIPHMIALWFVGAIALVLLFVAWLAILITGNYPRGLFDFVVGAQRWGMRANAYLFHMTDVYPPFSMQDDDQYPMRLTVEYPEKSSRLTAFFRWILVIPQAIIVWALTYVLQLLALVNIIVVIFTGKPNAEIFRIMVGINRWSARENLYALLATDKYPPFSMD
jgi:hypothetical protein